MKTFTYTEIRGSTLALVASVAVLTGCPTSNNGGLADSGPDAATNADAHSEDVRMGADVLSQDTGVGADARSQDAGQTALDTGQTALDTGQTALDTGQSADAQLMVQPCDLAPVGVWQQITPPQVSLPGPNGSAFGTNSFVLDPSNAGVVYLGTSSQGFYTTTDCGSTWSHPDTGRNGAGLDTGRQWTMAIDPTNPQVIYTNSGYGSLTQGLLKTTNGGVDWDVVWPPPVTDAGPNAVWPGVVGDNEFLGSVAMDPSDSQHLLLLFHAPCNPPHQPVCLGESTNGGQDWTIVEGDPNMAGAHGGSLFFLDNSDTWLFRSADLWRTSNHGASWTQISTISNDSIGSQIYRGSNGTFYMGLDTGLVSSPDGVNWSTIPNTGQFTGGIVGNGTTLFASEYSTCFDWGSSITSYITSTDNGTTWNPMPTLPPVQQGGYLGYDPVHHILYSTNCQDGFWRVRTQ